jgi:hypothetical protein
VAPPQESKTTTEEYVRRRSNLSKRPSRADEVALAMMASITHLNHRTGSIINIDAGQRI